METKVEKAWEHQGLKCIVLALPIGHRCGYVAVSKQHPFYGMDYNDLHERIYIEVHGGLTYSASTVGDMKDEGFWWFGYDCAHLGDKKDPTLITKTYSEVFSDSFDDPRATIKDLPYCIKECEKLATQLIGKETPHEPTTNP